MARGRRTDQDDDRGISCLVRQPPAQTGNGRDERYHPILLIWDHRLFQADFQGESVTLRPDVGEAFTLSPAQFGHPVERGELEIVSVATPSPTSQEIREALTRAGPKAQEHANERLRQILAYVRGEKITVTARSVQPWMAAYPALDRLPVHIRAFQ